VCEKTSNGVCFLRLFNFYNLCRESVATMTGRLQEVEKVANNCFIVTLDEFAHHLFSLS
jgi:hypothetical protein